MTVTARFHSKSPPGRSGVEFATAVMTDARLFEHWVLGHPRRFAAKVGWCPKGAEIFEGISEAVAEALGRISMAEKIRPEDDQAAGPPDGDDLLEVMSQAFKRLS
jgi:hypothetical protein